MTPEFAAALAVGMASIGATFGIGWIASKTVEAISRQPESASTLQTTMLIGCALAEAIPVLAVVVAFMIM